MKYRYFVFIARCFGLNIVVWIILLYQRGTLGAGFSFFVMKSGSFWTCILTIKLYWKRRHIGTSAKKNHTYESPLYRVQILIILYSNAPYIAIANKNMSQSCLTMGMAAAGEWLSFNISEKKSGQPLIVRSLSHTNSIFKVFPSAVAGSRSV